MKSLLILLVLFTSSGALFAGPVTYTFDVATDSPINPIHFSFTADGYLGTQSGPLSIEPFNITDSLGDSWTFTNGLINVTFPPTMQACFGLFAPPAIGDPSLCGAMTIPPGGGFLFIFGPGGPINLPATDGVFTVRTDYVLVSPSNVTYNGSEPGGQTTIMTVTSPEPTTAISFLAGLIALLGLTVRSVSGRSAGRMITTLPLLEMMECTPSPGARTSIVAAGPYSSGASTASALSPRRVGDILG